MHWCTLHTSCICLCTLDLEKNPGSASAHMPQPNKSFKHVLKFSKGIISSISMKLPTCLNDLNVHRFREVLFRIYSVVIVTTNMTFTFFPICALFIVENRFVGTGNYPFSFFFKNNWLAEQRAAEHTSLASGWKHNQQTWLRYRFIQQQ